MIIIQLLGGSKVYVDLQIDKSRCKGCHKKIWWASTTNGKKMPICQDDKGNWINHFYYCTKNISKNNEYIAITDGVNTDERKLKFYKI